MLRVHQSDDRMVDMAGEFENLYQSGSVCRFANRIALDPYPRHVHLLVADQRGNAGTHTVGAKAPAMVTALNRTASHTAIAEGDTTVWTDITQSEGGAIGLASTDHRLAQQRACSQTTGRQRR
jgi:hypothetical protein